MGDIILWIIVGLVAGGIASAVVPGRTPVGIVSALVAGIAGVVLGGWLLTTLTVTGTLMWLGSLLIGLIVAIGILYGLRAKAGRQGGARAA